MVEFLIRVTAEDREFVVSAGFDRLFAHKMYETFTLRDDQNRDVPHSKLLIEMHVEEKDDGIDGHVELPASPARFEDFEESQKERISRLAREAQYLVDKAVIEIERPDWVKRNEKS
ncbi:MAG: hypothetical protein RLW61_08550 [Gammaproteobacteria bacterium]